MNKRASQKPIKKARQGLFGSLAMRTLFISFVFIVVPLILYSAVLYTGDYKQRLKNIFNDLHMLEDDQIAYLEQFENYNLSVIHLLREIFRSVGVEKEVVGNTEINRILAQYAEKQQINGISFLKINKDGKLVCVSSTSPMYVGKDFTTAIDLGKKELRQDRIFIAEDPVFVWSLYFVRFIYSSQGELMGAVASTVSLDKLTDRLSDIRGWKNASLSILNPKLEVLASSSPGLIGTNFYVEMGEGADQGQIILKPAKNEENGFNFTLRGRKEFAVITLIPETNSYLMISIPSAYLLEQIFQYIARLAIFLIFIVVVGGLAAYLLTLRMAKPMQRLSHVMTEVGEGHFNQSYQLDRFGFEINFLGTKFNRMTKALIEYIEAVKQEKAAKEVYAKELQIGHQIQKSILPTANITLPQLDIATFYLAAQEVAGDFYDWLEKEDRIMVTIADGVGKGVSSCLYSFALRSILRSFSMVESNLEKLVKETNELFRQDTKDTYNFVTAFITIFDTKSRKLQYANCGHLPAFIKKENGKIEKITTKGMALGIEKLEEVEVNEITLEEGDMVIFYTDGITEAEDPKEAFYGEKRLFSLIEKVDVSTSKEMVDAIVSDLKAFTKDAKQSDDITLLVMTTKEST